MDRALATTLLTALIAVLATPVAATANPVDAPSGIYVDPDSTPAKWVRANANDPRKAEINNAIATKPMAKWFGNRSDISAAVSSYVGAAATANKLPVLVAYNITGRDCGSHSGGGAGSPEAYRTWSSTFAAAIGSRPAVVVIEPDAVAQLDCLDATQKPIRIGLLKHFTEQLKAKAPNASVYLDAGHSSWIAAAEMAKRLNSVGIANTKGFALNVSNYQTTANSLTYGKAVATALATLGHTKTYVVDTSRNGNGSNGQWCNPAGRRIGEPARVGGIGSGADMLLWIKIPGNSDGKCGIAPTTPAGTFTPALALHLIQGH